MLRVHSDKFCWKKTKATGVLVAKLEMGDFQALKTVMRVLVTLDFVDQKPKTEVSQFKHNVSHSEVDKGEIGGKIFFSGRI